MGRLGRGPPPPAQEHEELPRSTRSLLAFPQLCRSVCQEGNCRLSRFPSVIVLRLLATCVELLAAPGGPWGRARRHWLNSVERRLSTLANGSVSQKGGEPIVSLSLSLSSMKSERRPGPSAKGRDTRKREKPTPPTFSEAWLRTPEGWPAHPLSPPPSRNGRGGRPPLCKRPKYKAEKE